MQKLIFLFVSLICLMASCTADDIIGRTDAVDTLRADGYLRMCITMPSARDSRAANDVFENGLPAEYAIHSAVLVLFEGDTEELKAKFHSAYNLTTTNGTTNADKSQITTTATKVVRCLDNGNADFRKKQHFAIVLLNTGNIISISADNLRMSVAGQTWESGTSAQTLQKFLELVVSDSYSFYSPSQGFLMCSAPLADKPGGPPISETGLNNVKVRYAAHVDGHIYDTEREAQANPAAECFVERAVAKVTMPANQHGTKLAASKIDVLDSPDGTTVSSSSNDIPWKLIGWTLDNTNTKSYLVRNYDTSWNLLRSKSTAVSNPYRFIGTSSLSSPSLFRTYWAKDPNYSTDGKDHTLDLKQFVPILQEPFEYLPSAAATPTSTAADPYPMGFGPQRPQYCLENTFDVANQKRNQTTSIIAKVQIGDGTKDYYVVDNDKSHLYTWAGLIAQYGFDKKVKEAIAKHPLMQAKYAEKTSEKLLAHNCYYKMQPTVDGTYRISSIWAHVGKDSNNQDVNVELSLEETSSATWEQELGINYVLKYYPKGISYYSIRIKHFGDDLTPWNNGESSDVRPSTIYPGDDATRNSNYLGRYGVVRNNWYDVSITSILNIGEPIPMPPTDVPDDELNNYISVNINILSWTLRPQGAEL